MEKLGQAINNAVSTRKWKPIVLGRGGPSLSHLFFADDLVLMGEATVENDTEMYAIFDQFYVKYEGCGQRVYKICSWMSID